MDRQKLGHKARANDYLLVATFTFKVQNGDFVMGDDLGLGGGLALVTERQKFEQDIRGVLNTERSGLSRVLGSEGNPFELRASLMQAVTRALDAFALVQRSRQQAQRARSERFAGIRRLDVFPRKSDPRKFTFTLETYSEAGAASLLRLNSP